MHDLAFLIDFDNTLLDNDRLKRDMERRLAEMLGMPLADRFWSLYEAVRADTGVVDLIETARRLRDAHPAESACIDDALAALMSWEFVPYVFPRTFETLAHLDTLGLTVVLSDGDAVYQPMKIERSGVAAAVDRRVLVYPHKDEHLAEVCARFPARRYVLIDDKPRILAAGRAQLGDRVTTVHVRYGRYAREGAAAAHEPGLTVERFSDLLGCSSGSF